MNGGIIFIEAAHGVSAACSLLCFMLLDIHNIIIYVEKICSVALVSLHTRQQIHRYLLSEIAIALAA